MKFHLLQAAYRPKSWPAKTIHEGEKKFIEINTLEELMAFQKEVENELVLSDDTIWIYNGYME